MKHITR